MKSRTINSDSHEMMQNWRKQCFLVEFILRVDNTCFMFMYSRHRLHIEEKAHVVSSIILFLQHYAMKK